MTLNPKHPDRWNKATLCRTADRGEGNKSFKEVILTTCDKRNDEVANQVRIRIQGAISDLHASNGRYHDKCKNNFMAPRSIASASRKDADENPNDTAFSNLISRMVSNASHIWSSIELHNIYKYLGGSVSRKYLINQVKEYFGEHLIPLSSPGLSTMFVFANHASSIMKIEKDDDEMADITNVAKKIKDEIKVIPFDKSKYRTSIDLNVALGESSPTLLALLSEISSSLSNSLPAALIGNMVTSSFCRKYTSLQLSLGILLREKKTYRTFLLLQCMLFL